MDLEINWYLLMEALPLPHAHDVKACELFHDDFVEFMALRLYLKCALDRVIMQIWIFCDALLLSDWMIGRVHV